MNISCKKKELREQPTIFKENNIGLALIHDAPRKEMPDEKLNRGKN